MAAGVEAPSTDWASDAGSVTSLGLLVKHSKQRGKRSEWLSVLLNNMNVLRPTLLPLPQPPLCQCIQKYHYC